MAAKEDLTGQKFFRLTVLEEASRSSSGIRRWRCICDCGNERIVAGADLKRGHTKSCGCYNKQRISETTLKDLSGQRFGELEVLYRDMEYTGKGCSTHWYCKCHKCGSIKSMPAESLRNGAVSCGCIKSKGEYKIASILKENNIKFICEYKFKDNKRRRYDFALLDENNKIIRLIEFDGLQHFYRPRAKHWAASSTLEETQQRDKEKNEIAKQKGIPLVRIPYWKIEDITLENLLNDKYLVKENI